MDARAFLLVALALAAGGCTGAGPAEEKPFRVDRMAALGDSITTAANADGRVGDRPQHSWATGLHANDSVLSHHERLLAQLDEGGALNLARGGARMADLPRQAERAVAHQARYVTILMGGNDVCAATVRGMTPVDAYRRHFRAAAQTLVGGLPDGAVVLVLSVPDLTQVRELHWDNPHARFVWRTFGLCQALLGERATPEDVEAVRSRIVAYNAMLREESAASGFRFDDEALFRAEQRAEDVSPLDFFHPSVEGQRRIADVAWKAGPFATDG